MKKIAYLILVAVVMGSSSCMKVLTKKVLTVTLPATVEPFTETVFYTPKDSSEYDGFENYQSIFVFIKNKNTRKKVTKKEVVKVIAWSAYTFTPNETIVVAPAKTQYRQYKKIAKMKGRRKIKKFFKGAYVPISQQKVSGKK